MDKNVAYTLEDILQICFGCKKPFDKNGKQTVAGVKAYEKLIATIYGLENIGVIALGDVVGFAVIEDGVERAAGGDKRATPSPLQQILRLGLGPGSGVRERHNNRTRAVPMHLFHYLFAKQPRLA